MKANRFEMGNLKFRRVFVRHNNCNRQSRFDAPSKNRYRHVLACLRYFLAKPFSTSTGGHKNKTPNFRQSVQRYFLTSVSAQASASVQWATISVHAPHCAFGCIHTDSDLPVRKLLSRSIAAFHLEMCRLIFFFFYSSKRTYYVNYSLETFQ